MISIFIIAILCYTIFTHNTNNNLIVDFKNDHWRYQPHVGGDYWTEAILSMNASVFNEIIKDNADYHSKKPFPHLVRDNIFPMSILNATIDEIKDDPELKSGCAAESTT